MRIRLLMSLLAVSILLSGALWLRNTSAATGLQAYVEGRTLCGVVDSVRAVQLSTDQRRHAWQLKLETSRGPSEGEVTLFRTPEGDWWAPSTNKTGLQFGIAEHAREPYGLPAKGQIVLDAGANVGLFTRAALDAGAKLVVAIEPVPANVEALKRNFSAEIAEGRVVVYPKGVWNAEDTLEMYLYSESQLDSFTMTSRPESVSAPKRVALPLTTIDALVRELNLPRVDFIKMDIEGAEKQALEGGAETLRRYRPRLAVATENLPNDAVAIPQSVFALVPEYEEQRGECVQLENGIIAPEVTFFAT